MNMASGIITTEIVAVLTYLLPGLIAAAIFYALTPHPKPSAFERIVQALIFTVLAQLLADQVPQSGQPATTEPASPENWRVATSVPIAVVLALLATYVSNNDILYWILRKLGVSKETSRPSEWYSAFARKDLRYVVLHLNDRRRLYGWPAAWPNRSDHGHFRLTESTWLNEENQPIESNVVETLIPAHEVQMVEFLPEHQTDHGE